MNVETTKTLVDTIQAAYRGIDAMSHGPAREEQINQWVGIGNVNIMYLTDFLTSENQSVSVRQSVQNVLALIQSWLIKIQQLRRVVGGEGGSGEGNDTPNIDERVHWDDLMHAFDRRIRTGVISNLVHRDLRAFLDDVVKVTTVELRTMLRNEGGFKVDLILSCKFENFKNDGVCVEMKNFNTRNVALLPSTNLDEWFDDDMKNELLTQVEEFEQRDSGWSMKEIINAVVNINKYQPLRGGISTFVQLPQDIKLKKAVINIQNNDERCFIWSVLAALYPSQHHAERVHPYRIHLKDIRYAGINFPTPLSDVKKFENLNNLRINVYGIESQWYKNKAGVGSSIIVPLYLSKNLSIPDDDDEKMINLLMLESNKGNNSDNQKPRFHFALIKDLSRLVRSQVTRHHSKGFFCGRCLCHYTSQSSLDNHKQDCGRSNEVRITFPDKLTLKFENFRNVGTVPFVVYADIEYILKPASDNKSQKNIAHSVGYYVHCSYNKALSGYYNRRGNDCIDWFVERLADLAHHVDSIIKNVVPMEQLTQMQKDRYMRAKTCYICTQPFSLDNAKCYDYCHLTGKYRGPAHNECNLNYRESHIIPIVFHNFSGYDSNFLIKSLANSFEGEISVLAVNKEQFISFTKRVGNSKIKLRFIDSFRFMGNGIEKLASYIDNTEKKITRAFYSDQEKFTLMRRKGVFPYEYIDDWSKLEEKKLPFKKDFYKKLNDSNITDEEYQHAKNVWAKFNLTTLGEYSDLYLKTDVLLLADIFQNFRVSCMKTYGLDALYYYTCPGLAFDAMLKHTGVKLQLLNDPEMILFIEKSIRGGVAQCPNRYAQANNRFMGTNFDASKEESYLMYFDVNNLYGAAMSESLPRDSFEWEHEPIDIMSIKPDASIGYILEVDLEYPVELHDQHKDLPLCPEHYVPPGGKNRKLMTTLLPKEKYVLHYRNLQQYLSLGMRLTRVHRILKFSQSPWLKSYIDLNTNLRKQSRNEFDKNFYKLMNNVVFGKTMENVRTYKDVKLVQKWEGRAGARALIAKTNFDSCIVLDSELVIIELKRLKVCFNKPIYVGAAILDLSKIILYDFHYGYIKKNFRDDQAKLMYTDTDSLIYHFTVPNIYDLVKRDAHEYFDTSDYSPDNEYSIPLINKKKLGLMKDENNGIIMTEFIGLRAKLYAFKTMGDDKVKKRADGIKGSTLKSITFDDYKRCLHEYKNLSRSQCMIRNRKDAVSTDTQNKLALSWRDDKRQLIPGQTDTLPWGFQRPQ